MSVCRIECQANREDGNLKGGALPADVSRRDRQLRFHALVAVHSSFVSFSRNLNRTSSSSSIRLHRLHVCMAGTDECCSEPLGRLLSALAVAQRLSDGARQNAGSDHQGECRGQPADLSHHWSIAQWMSLLQDRTNKKEEGIKIRNPCRIGSLSQGEIVKHCLATLP